LQSPFGINIRSPNYINIVEFEKIGSKELKEIIKILFYEIILELSCHIMLFNDGGIIYGTISKLPI
jgi:hypothetical protein